MGDPRASLAFVRRFQSKVFGLALAVVGEVALAEDVSQQTFERAWRHAQMFDPRRGTVSGWISTIAHNLAVDVVRLRRPTPVDPEDLLGELAILREGPEPRAMQSERSHHVREALADLPSGQARALVMASFYGMTAAEIGEAERIPIGTAKTRIRTAMIRLRESLDIDLRVDET